MTTSLLTHRRFALLALALGAAACGRPADRQDWRSRLPEGRRVTYGDSRPSADGTALAASYALPVRALEDDPQTGVPTWVRLDTEAMPDVNPRDWRGEAMAFVDAQSALFGVAPADLLALPRSVQAPTPDQTVVSFGVARDGREIRDALLQLVFFRTPGGAWRLGEWLNRSHAGRPVAEAKGAPQSFAALAEAWGEPDLSAETSRAVLVATPDADGALVLVPAREWRATDAASGESYVITVRDGGHDVLEAYRERVMAFDFRAKVYPRTYLDPELSPQALPFAKLSNQDGSQTADVDGAFAQGGAGAYTLELGGKRVRIVNNTSTTTLTAPVTVPENGAAEFSETDRRAVNAYTTVNRINKFTRRHLREAEASLLGRAITVKINVTGNCNAFYDPATVSISLFAAGNNCANMANVNDVLYHEWGHGLDDVTGTRPGIVDGAFSEGLADVLSAFYVGASGLAPGFMLNSATPIRNLKNTKSYPADRGEVHAEGQIIGGAFWDLREALIARHGATRGAVMAETYFLRHLLTTDTYMDSYQAVLRLDDDDGNPATPSPNACLINAAFAAHGLATALNCQDAPVTPPRVDEALFLAVKGNGTSGLTLMASSPQAASMALCLGGRAACAAGTRTDVAFTLDGAKDGVRLFVATAPVALKEQDVLTLVAKDAAGKVIGTRTVKAFAK